MWQAVLAHGAGIIDHWLFPATVGLLSFTGVRLGFTVKDLRRRSALGASMSIAEAAQRRTTRPGADAASTR